MRHAHSAAQGARLAKLEAFAGEYTDPAEPGERYSFYVQDGKLDGRIRALGSNRAQASRRQRSSP